MSFEKRASVTTSRAAIKIFKDDPAGAAALVKVAEALKQGYTIPTAVATYFPPEQQCDVIDALYKAAAAPETRLPAPTGKVASQVLPAKPATPQVKTAAQKIALRAEEMIKQSELNRPICENMLKVAQAVNAGHSITEAVVGCFPPEQQIQATDALYSIVNR